MRLLPTLAAITVRDARAAQNSARLNFSAARMALARSLSLATRRCSIGTSMNLAIIGRRRRIIECHGIRRPFDQILHRDVQPPSIPYSRWISDRRTGFSFGRSAVEQSTARTRREIFKSTIWTSRDRKDKRPRSSARRVSVLRSVSVNKLSHPSNR